MVRRFLLTLWNTYAFFVTYANIEGWRPSPSAAPVAERPPLDRWLLSELNVLVERVDRELADFNATGAGRSIATFVDRLSNWYVRRSRRRFWEGDQAAFATLYETLVTLTKLWHPTRPS
ncbi:MAG: class I tRNA ligase family protein [Ardenticatenia bacterium]|nr:class I tRNA ligase family protein [Ardenticatenia bacterium]